MKQCPTSPTSGARPLYARQWIAVETIPQRYRGQRAVRSGDFAASLQQIRNGLDGDTLAELEHVHAWTRFSTATIWQ